MALPPVDTTHEAFIREVDEGLRADQAIQFWRNYGRWVLIAVAGALLVFAAVLYFQSRNARIAGKQGEDYDQVLRDLEAGRTAQAQPTIDTLATSGKPGFRAMARFAQADLLLAKKDVKGAAAKYAEIAGDSSIAAPFRELAVIRQTSAEFDTLKPEVVIGRLKEMAVPESHWFGTAGEMVAISYLKQGKRDLAGKLFSQLGKTATVPQSLRQRSVQMASLLGVQAPDQSGENKVQ